MTRTEALTLPKEQKELIEFGRQTVLEDFENLLSVDAFVGFTEQEWNGVKKFFAMNKALRESHGN